MDIDIDLAAAALANPARMRFAVGFLSQAFPVVAIDCDAVQTRLKFDRDRARLELQIAKVCGIGWVEMTVKQARGFSEVLGFLAGPTVSQIAPGFLKFLAEPILADAMDMEIPDGLLRIDQNPELDVANSSSFSNPQRETIANYFRWIVRQELYPADDRTKLFQEVIASYSLRSLGHGGTSSDP